MLYKTTGRRDLLLPAKAKRKPAAKTRTVQQKPQGLIARVEGAIALKALNRPERWPKIRKETITTGGIKTACPNQNNQNRPGQQPREISRIINSDDTGI